MVNILVDTQQGKWCQDWLYKKKSKSSVCNYRGKNTLKSKLRSQRGWWRKEVVCICVWRLCFVCAAQSKVTAWKYWLLRWPAVFEDVLGNKILNFPSMRLLPLPAAHRNKYSTRILVRRAKNWGVGDFKHDTITYPKNWFTFTSSACLTSIQIKNVIVYRCSIMSARKY